MPAKNKKRGKKLSVSSLSEASSLETTLKSPNECFKNMFQSAIDMIEQTTQDDLERLEAIYNANLLLFTEEELNLVVDDLGNGPPIEFGTQLTTTNSNVVDSGFINNSKFCENATTIKKQPLKSKTKVRHSRSSSVPPNESETSTSTRSRRSKSVSVQFKTPMVSHGAGCFSTKGKHTASRFNALKTPVSLSRFSKLDEQLYSSSGSPVLSGGVKLITNGPQTFIPIRDGKVVIVEDEDVDDEFNYPVLDAATKMKVKRIIKHLEKLAS